MKLALTALLLALSVPLIAADADAVNPPAELSAAKKEDLHKAQKAISAAIAADPSNLQLQLHLGFIYHKLGELDAAQDAFEKVAAADPSETSASYMLALIYEKKGMKARAIASWKSVQANAKDPNLLAIAAKHLEQLQPK